jgi:hypothetical protein
MNSNGTPGHLRLWRPGESGNPDGRPKSFPKLVKSMFPASETSRSQPTFVK